MGTIVWATQETLDELQDISIERLGSVEQEQVDRLGGDR